MTRKPTPVDELLLLFPINKPNVIYHLNRQEMLSLLSVFKVPIKSTSRLSRLQLARMIVHAQIKYPKPFPSTPSYEDDELQKIALQKLYSKTSKQFVQWYSNT